MTRRPLALAALLSLAPLAAVPTAALAQSTFENRFTGELGVGLYGRTEVVRETGDSALLLPYLYADYGRFFARVDTFGAKLLPLGAGHLEVVARISTEGWKADKAALRGLSDRDNPIPLGIGTLQRTPFGAFFLYAMHDLTSGGAYLEGTWGARFDAGPVALYPLLGVEYRSAAYVRHLYGVDAAQASASGIAGYAPGASTVPMAGLAATIPITGPWAVQLQWRHRWLDSAIRRSPIAAADSVDSGHIAITYEFK